MGYSFSSTGALVCDGCGTTGGVRKRPCTFKVSGTPYCYPPALCGDCLRKRGGIRGAHAHCAEGAAAMQAQEDQKQAALDAGERFARSAFGSGQTYQGHAVPAGLCGVLFAGRDAASQVWMLVDEAQYCAVHREGRPRLSQFPEARSWEGVSA